ncbi:transcription factor RFX4-like [Actinia tenebrosa]|uniref:DNA-binding protein RFX6 n=1 Tax=Actinia tenebrosa TaxID=6105 RepID=A0A6P8INN6_ACTTE|nr:transcription factor RFX4-like [Actinia tenebrosa]
MASQSHGLAQQDHELSDLQIYCYERPRRIKIKKSYKEFASDEENSEMGIGAEDIKKRRTKVSKRKESPSRLALEKKQRQLTDTLRWLGENYELKEGLCLPRCVMYTHYLDFCKKSKLGPSGPATFGKVIRQKFPKLTTRRLGTRGQSKYHYYGIRVKETSQYFHAGYSKQGLTRFSTMKAKGGEGSMKKFALNSKARTLLPDFPNAKRLNLPKGVSQQKVETFIMMYRTHCQRLLDTVISANFDGINTFILHFWQGMPSHMISVLQSPIIVDVIAICDSILYKVLIDVLIPSSIQDLPDSLREEIREFASNLQVWLKDSLREVPKNVQDVKLQVAQKFGRALTRQVSFVHLAQTARSVLLSYDSVSRMINDLRKIDFNLINSQSMFLLGNEDIPTLTKTFVQEFEGLLSKQAPLEAYTEWLDSVVDRCVLKELSDDSDDELFERRATKFLGSWSFITSKVLEDLTLRSAPSFGVFHLIHATFQEYVLLIIENQKMLEVDKKLEKALQSHLKEDFSNDSIEQWVNVKQAEYEVRAESMETKNVGHSDESQTQDKTPQSNNNDSINNNNNVSSDKTFNKKVKISSRNKESESSRSQVKAAPRSFVMSIPQASASSPAIVPRPLSIIPSSITSIPSNSVGSIANQTYGQLQLQPSVGNNTVTDRQGRNVQQYLYNDEMSRNATPGSEMTASYHGQDFINPYDKSIFNSNLGIANPEFLSNPWFQPENPSLTVLNNVGYADPNVSSADQNLEMSYHRSGDFGFGYANELGIFTSGIHPTEHQTPISHRSDIPYSDQGKDVDFSNYQNLLRYNSMYYESMRNSGQSISSDVLNYSGILPTPANSMDIEGILAHEAQMNRLGVGAV